MIDLYTAATFNGRRIPIMLEETGLAYTVHSINLAQGQQRQPDFLKLNPRAQIPVLVDHDCGSSEPLVLTQSIAILQYLAEKTGQLLPNDSLQRAKVYEWMQFHAIDIGSVIFSAFYLDTLSSSKHPQAAKLLRTRVHDLYGHFDQQLQGQEYLAGPDYSITDIAVIPAVINRSEELMEYPHLLRWITQLQQRPAVQRGMTIPKGV